MIVHSKQFVTGLDDKCIQPNAVDIRISGITQLNNNPYISQTIQISEDDPKAFFYRDDLALGHDGYWILGPGSYDFVTEHFVEIPAGVAGWIVPRSTFVRNGCTIVCGLYDSGYNGVVGGILHNFTTNNIKIKPGTRVGQFLTLSAESSHLYDGHYNQNGGLSRA